MKHDVLVTFYSRKSDGGSAIIVPLDGGGYIAYGYMSETTLKYLGEFPTKRKAIKYIKQYRGAEPK